jgi:hypothetical protein
MDKITIDGNEYDIETLSEAAKGQIASIRYCDIEINKAQMMLAALQTAKNAYSQALAKEIATDSDDAIEIEVPDNISFD